MCHQSLPLDSFYKGGKRKNGDSFYFARCKKCTSIIAKNKRLENIEERRAKEKENYWKNKERIRSNYKNWRNRNKDLLNAKRREWVKNNLAKHKESQKKYRDRNKEKIKEYHKKYRENNRDIIRQRANDYRKNNPLHRKKEICRQNLRDAFARGKGVSNKRIVQLTGIDIKYLKEYLEGTWEKRYGYKRNGEKCHIDHIIPLLSAS